jgi:hypothetical protein
MSKRLRGELKPRGTLCRYWLEAGDTRRWCSLKLLHKMLSELFDQYHVGSDTGAGVHFVYQGDNIVARFTEEEQ